jgi:hypothetical protein
VVFSGYSASSTSKAGHHDIAEILLKVALNIKSNQNLSRGGAEILMKLSGITFIRHAQNHWKAK